MKNIIVLVVLFASINILYGQNEGMFPVTINEALPEYTLTDSEGGQISSVELLGKKVMLIFIRGKVTKGIWCPICQYQYLELAEMESKYKLRKKHNMEILFVMPYSTDSLENWINAFPKSIDIIEGWKYPKNEKDLPQATIEWMNYAREFFPATYKDFPGSLDLSLPVVFDVDQSVSKGLQIYRQEWSGTIVEQNVPTILIIDEKGLVKFKYFSQYTHDRPNAIYIKKYIKNMIE